MCISGISHDLFLLLLDPFPPLADYIPLYVILHLILDPLILHCMPFSLLHKLSEFCIPCVLLHPFAFKELLESMKSIKLFDSELFKVVLIKGKHGFAFEG